MNRFMWQPRVAFPQSRQQRAQSKEGFHTASLQCSHPADPTWPIAAQLT
jgi:hypothetical protein